MRSRARVTTEQVTRINNRSARQQVNEINSQHKPRLITRRHRAEAHRIANWCVTGAAERPIESPTGNKH